MIFGPYINPQVVNMFNPPKPKDVIRRNSNYNYQSLCKYLTFSPFHVNSQ